MHTPHHLYTPIIHHLYTPPPPPLLHTPHQINTAPLTGTVAAMEDDSPDPMGPEHSTEATEKHRTLQGKWGTSNMQQRPAPDEKEKKREGGDAEEEGGEADGMWVWCGERRCEWGCRHCTQYALNCMDFYTSTYTNIHQHTQHHMHTTLPHQSTDVHDDDANNDTNDDVDDQRHVEAGHVVVRYDGGAHATAHEGDGWQGEQEEQGMLPEERVEMLRRRVEEQLHVAGMCVWRVVDWKLVGGDGLKNVSVGIIKIHKHTSKYTPPPLFPPPSSPSHPPFLLPPQVRVM